jgi:hypothetical protein
VAVIIGMDPHKRSATIEVIDERAQIFAVGRFGTDKAGYAETLQAGRMFPDRVWVVGVATASAGTLRTGWFNAGRPWWMCLRSGQLGCRWSPPGNGRKTDPVGRALGGRWSRCAPRTWCRSTSTRSWSWGCWSTAATSSAAPGPRRSTGCTGSCWSFSQAGQSSSSPRTRHGR